MDTAGTDQFGRALPRCALPAEEHRLTGVSVAMRDLYMKAGHGFLLVFSITSQSSLAELADLRDEIIRIKGHEDVPMVIVGNKSDLEEQRVVSRSKAFAVSQHWGAPYYETSARTRSQFSRRPLPSLGSRGAYLHRRAAPRLTIITENVDEIFTDLCRQMLRRDDAFERAPESDSHTKKESSYGLRGLKRRNKHGSKMQCVIL